MGNREVVKKPQINSSKDPSFSTPYSSAPECLRGSARSVLSELRKDLSSQIETGKTTLSDALEVFNAEVKRLKKDDPNANHPASWQVSEFLKYATNNSEKNLVNGFREQYSSDLDQTTKDKLVEKYGAINSTLDRKPASVSLISQPDPIVFSQIPQDPPSVSWESYDRPKEPSAFEVTIIAPSVAVVMFLVEKASDLADLLAGQKSTRTTSVSSDFEPDAILVSPSLTDQKEIKKEPQKNEFSSPDSKIEPMAEMPLVSSPIETEKPVSAFISSDSQVTPILTESLISEPAPTLSISENTNAPDEKSLAIIRSKISSTSPPILEVSNSQQVKPKKLGFFIISKPKIMTPLKTPVAKSVKSKSPKKSQKLTTVSKSALSKKRDKETKQKIEKTRITSASSIQKTRLKSLPSLVSAPKSKPISSSKIILSKNKRNQSIQTSILHQKSSSKIPPVGKISFPALINPVKPKSKSDSNSLIKSKIIKTKKNISKRIKKEEKKDASLLKKEKEKFKTKLELLLKKRSSSKPQLKRSK